MIPVLLFTILAEGIIALGYCTWQRKPVAPILVTSVLANVLTQSLLWGVLNFFFPAYLVPLLIAEIFIWLIESFALRAIPANHMRYKEALGLSLAMNLISFGAGWFLPL